MINRAAVLALVFVRFAAAAEPSAGKSGQLQDIVVKGEENDELSAGKPVFDVSFDRYESIRSSLKPDESRFLAESAVLGTWLHNRPDRLKNEHLLEPWNDALKEFTELPLPVRDQLASGLGHPPAAKELKDASWSLSVIDEEGKSIRKFAGTGLPPEQVVWNGRSDQNEWLRAGHAYSLVYKFSESSATARTILGPAIQFVGLVHQDGEGQLIGLDSAALFGEDRKDKDVLESGKSLLRAAADWIRRYRAYGYPILLRAYGPDAATAQRQAAGAKAYLASELGLPPERIAAEAAAASDYEQRLDLVVGGRSSAR